MKTVFLLAFIMLLTPMINGRAKFPDLPPDLQKKEIEVLSKTSDILENLDLQAQEEKVKNLAAKAKEKFQNWLNRR